MDLSQIDFRGANLMRAAFRGANLDGARFIGAHLRHAGFHECKKFTHCDFSGADLRYASFARAYVSHACFRRAALHDAYFVDCRCHSTDFSGAVLESSTALHSQFWSCNLEDVRFDGSDFTEALLFESEFPVQVGSASSTSGTRPIRFVPEINTSLVPFTESHSSPINCPMDNLITVVTRFQLPAGVTADQIRAAFDEAAPRFRNVPGLVRKQFLRSKDCRTAGGVYLWNDECAARAFMNEHVAPMIREKFHVDPTVEFYDSPVIVEN